VSTSNDAIKRMLNDRGLGLVEIRAEDAFAIHGRLLVLKMDGTTGRGKVFGFPGTDELVEWFIEQPAMPVRRPRSPGSPELSPAIRAQMQSALDQLKEAPDGS
jgi:hypothetical protein